MDSSYGKWLDAGVKYIKEFKLAYIYKQCSECRKPIVRVNSLNFPSRCPNCGIRMEKINEESNVWGD